MDKTEGGKANKGGRPPDTRPTLTLRIAPEVQTVLEHVESQTSLSCDEVARSILYMAIFDPKKLDEYLPSIFNAAKARVKPPIAASSGEVFQFRAAKGDRTA